MIVLQHLTQLKQCDRRPIVATIGNFDGVHSAHRKILQTVKRTARQKKARTMVITFNNHPHHVGAQKKKPILTSLLHRLILFKRDAIDLCYVFNFTVRLKNSSAEDFLKNILFKHFPLTHIIVGYNFRFGKNRTGTPAMIAAYARSKGIGCTIVKPIKQKQKKISSSRIRSLIAGGKLKQAETLLGKPYSMFAHIVRGEGRGKKLGYPTANLDVHSEVLPPEGVYIVTVAIWHVEKKREKKGIVLKESLAEEDLIGVLNLGHKPTFRKTTHKLAIPCAEVHIIDFFANIRDKLLEITFVKKIRDERKFSDHSMLCSQIKKDIVQTKRYFK